MPVGFAGIPCIKVGIPYKISGSKMLDIEQRQLWYKEEGGVTATHHIRKEQLRGSNWVL